MINIPALIARARAALFRRHSRIFNFERDVLGPHIATWARDVIVSHKQSYDEYLASDWWQRRARAKRYSTGYRCEECGESDRVLHVHHLTYARLGRERDEDLEVLCESCHRGKHGIDIQDRS